MQSIVTCRFQQFGVSLIELMVGITISMLIVMGALSIYTSTSVGTRNTLNSAKLNIEISGATEIMIEDIRRAGFGGDLFTKNNTDLAVHNNGSCITYSYDQDSDGKLAQSSPYEFFGFRIQNNEVQMRNGGSGDTSSCATDLSRPWEGITDSETIQIDAPAEGRYFTINYQCLRIDTNAVGLDERCLSGNGIFEAAKSAATTAGNKIKLVEVREVTINIPGHIKNDDAMRIEFQETVTVRNHRIVIVP